MNEQAQAASLSIGYARVSTGSQNLDQQRADLKAAGCIRLFEEKASGAKRDRPELGRMLDHLRAGDVVTVTRLDRLARSTRDLLEIADKLRTIGAGLRSLAEPWADTTTPAGRMVLTVFAGIADFERSLILTRTTAGRKAAQARGVKFGRPSSLSSEQIQQVRALLSQGRPMSEIAAQMNVHATTLYRALKQQPHEPNALTAETIRKGDRGEDVFYASNSTELFRQLGIEETKGNVYAALGMDDAEEMAEKAALADQVQEGIFAGYTSTEDAAKQLGIPLSILKDLLRGQFRTISKADMHDYIYRLHHPPAAPTKGKRRRADGDKAA